jgi:hypothetical protein
MATLRAKCVSMTVDGKLLGWVWFEATAEVPWYDDPTWDQLRELHAKGKLHGLFDTKHEALIGARRTLLGPDCKVVQGAPMSQSLQ